MPLADDFSAEVNTVDKTRWDEISRDFSDANIYQTWSYEVAQSGRSRVSHLLVNQGSSVVAAAQARIVKIPYLNLAAAYIRCGPLWKSRSRVNDLQVFRQALRALRAEYVGRRRFVVRIIPNSYDCQHEGVQRIFEEEGYVPRYRAKLRRTILIDIRPSLQELYQGLHQKWRYYLKKARKQNFELIGGEEDALFEVFERIYAEMLDRKQFVDFTDPDQSRTIQRELMPDQKMRVILCTIEGEVCAGGICSALGDTGIYLFGATSNRGTKNNASYLVHWSMLEWVKSRGCQFYDLNGINPTRNPGGYLFKSRLAGAYGREIHSLDEFDAYPSATVRLLVATADLLRSNLKMGQAYLSHWRGRK